MPEEENIIEVPVAWVGVDELPIFHANQFLAVSDEGTGYLTIGQQVPPAVIGTIEERLEQLQQLQFVPVKPIVRLAMNPAKLRDLISVLELTLTNCEEQEEAKRDPRDSAA